MSDSEEKFRGIIENVLNTDFPKKRPKWLINEQGNRLELDGYNEELKIAFEYQGRGHFEKVSDFGGEKALIKNQLHDEIKRKTCKEMSILLLEPDYKMCEGDFYKMIKNIER